MTRTKALIFCLFPLFLHAQDYTLFGSDDRKLFSTIEDYACAGSVVMDSSWTNQDTTRVFPLMDLSDEWVESFDCGWWGDYACLPLEKPSWLGRSIEMNPGGELFVTTAFDTLLFDFQDLEPSPGTFYSDSLGDFTIEYAYTQWEEVLGVEDSIRVYVVQYLDTLGEVQPCPISQVKVGKDLGLLEFFRVDSFPMILQPIRLIGDENAELGLYQISQADMHDFQPGDFFQRNTYNYYWPEGEMPTSTTSISNFTIISRTETADSIYYEVDWCQFDPNVFGETYGNALWGYSKTIVMQWLPFEYFTGDRKSFKQVDYCGLKLWTLSFDDEAYLGFCPIEECWGPVDTQGPQPSLSHSWVVGLGEYTYNSSIWQPSLSSVYDRHITYFSRNGVSCGDQIIAGIDDTSMPDNELEVYPNPATDVVTVVCSNLSLRSSFQLVDHLGRVTKSWDAVQAISQGTYYFDLSHVSPGIYLLVDLNSRESASVMVR